MEEISRYDIELYLNQNGIILLDAYINKDKDLILEIEKAYNPDFEEETFIAEMELYFREFSNIAYDSEFENFLIQLHDKETILIE